MAQTRISIAAANYMLDALVTYLDAGSGSPQHATIEVFTASQPANPLFFPFLPPPSSFPTPPQRGLLVLSRGKPSS